MVQASEIDRDDANSTLSVSTDVFEKTNNLSSLSHSQVNEILSDGEASFTQLEEDISDNTVELTGNYAYNSTKDGGLVNGITY